MNREAYERQYKLGYQRGAMDSEKKLGEVYDALIEMQTMVKTQLGKRLPVYKEGDTSDFTTLAKVYHQLINLVGP